LPIARHVEVLVVHRSTSLRRRDFPPCGSAAPTMQKYSGPTEKVPPQRPLAWLGDCAEIGGLVTTPELPQSRTRWRAAQAYRQGTSSNALPSFDAVGGALQTWGRAGAFRSASPDLAAVVGRRAPGGAGSSHERRLAAASRGGSPSSSSAIPGASPTVKSPLKAMDMAGISIGVSQRVGRRR
jgi:hypothetical protein